MQGANPNMGNVKPETMKPSWLEMLMNSFPDFAASKGISPPADANNTVQAAQVPAQIQNGGQQLQDPTLAAEQYKNQMPAPVVPQVQAPVVPPAQAAKAEPPPPDESLFPAMAIQPSADDIAAAAANPIGSSDTVMNVGKALSGVKTPTIPQFQQPNAPGIPQAHAIQSSLLDILNAAGLTPKTPATVGMNLNTRIG